VLLAPVVVITSIWLYTLVFAFASLWFGHYTLAQLSALRRVAHAVAPRPPASNEAAVLDLVEVVNERDDSSSRRAAAVAPAPAHKPFPPDDDRPPETRHQPSTPPLT
jgi:hypothetical protein